jgi:hypothetical protein
MAGADGQRSAVWAAVVWTSPRRQTTPQTLNDATDTEAAAGDLGPAGVREPPGAAVRRGRPPAGERSAEPPVPPVMDR